MGKQSNFLPQRVSEAIKSITKRIVGCVLLVLGIWALCALVVYNQYLDGFATAASFGSQSIMGNVIGFLVYAVGFVPALFAVLCLVRWGISWAAAWLENMAPEYNFLRFVVAMFVGAAGLGMIMPSGTWGGMIGYIASSDIGALIGNFEILVGIILLCAFLFLAGTLLHVRWSHIVAVGRMLWHGVRWLMSVFHLAPPVQYIDDDVQNQSDEDGEDEEEPDEDNASDGRVRARIAKRRVKRAKSGAIKKKDGQIYELPDPEFLERSNFGKNVITPELKRNAAAMEVHFAEYGVQGKVVGITPGPIVTLYECMPESGVRMVDIKKTVTDMTRAMATENIRIAHIPNTQLIGVEMVNLTRQMVRFRSLVDNDIFVNSKYKIPLALGVDIGGNPMYFDLAKMPHMLIAGRTGSGKSVFVQSIIMSVVYHFTPDKCKLMIIDPKGVDFGFWDDIPHLITPIVKLDPGAAVNALKWAVREMEERYKQLQLVNARNIESYNEIVASKRENGEKITQQVAVGTDEETGELLFETQELDLSDMSYIVIIIDEVADLMSLARKEVEACVQRIAQKARAAGIHLVMATQRPDTSVITGVIKANFPTRVSFQARSAIDSMTTLGEKGAEQLLSCGDMLFSEAGRVPVRIHGAFISDEEMTRVGDFLRSEGEPEYAEGVTDAEAGGASSVGGGAIPGMPMSKADKDADLYTQAKEYVLRDKKPTISYIQRRLRIGYNKAAGFIEQMEAEGIISPPDANNKRHIL